MDKVGLMAELRDYKKFSIQQFEEIKKLKVEIIKIKKLAAQQVKDVKLQYDSHRRDEWMSKPND